MAHGQTFLKSVLLLSEKWFSLIVFSKKKSPPNSTIDINNPAESMKDVSPKSSIRD